MPRTGRLAASAVLCALLLAAMAAAGCRSLPVGRDRVDVADAYPATELVGVPFFPDTAYYCGPAALASALGWSGVDTSLTDLADGLYIPQRHGTLQPEMLARARRAGRLAYLIAPRLEALAAELAAGHPVVVLQNLGLSWVPRWHYAVAVGMMPERDMLVLRSGVQRRHRVAAVIFDRTWARSGRWAFVTPAPGALPATARPKPLFHALADLEATAGVDASLPYWHSAVERWPRAGRLAVGLANALHATGRTPAAAAVLRRAAEGGATLPGIIHNNLAMLEAELGDWAAAEAAARRAVAIGGSHAAAFRATLENIRRRAVRACSPMIHACESLVNRP